MFGTAYENRPFLSRRIPGRIVVRDTDEGDRIMRKIRGFTLIELLVVIAIVALLMAVLMPMTLPFKSASAPPLFPGLIEASV